MIWVEAKRRRQVAHVSNHSSGDTRQSGAISHLLNDQLIIINVPQWSKVRDYLSHLADAHRLLVRNNEIKSLFNHPPGCHGEHISLFIHPSILPSIKDWQLFQGCCLIFTPFPEKERGAFNVSGPRCLETSCQIQLNSSTEANDSLIKHIQQHT